MQYQCIDGRRYDLSSLNNDDSQIFGRLLSSFESSRSWIEFQQSTSRDVIYHAKRVLGTKWVEHSLYKIQLDLVGRKGIMTGDFKIEDVCDMLVVPEGIRGIFFTNADLELRLTLEQLDYVMRPVIISQNDGELKFYSASECSLMDENDRDTGRKATLKFDDSIVVQGNILVAYFSHVYHVIFGDAAYRKIIETGSQEVRGNLGAKTKILLVVKEPSTEKIN
ncbi:hypothetical protein HY483_03670 [Candidatus Woesearchaeota archaeon]|nr:hypothetical protein [Candidatus Woesearchaeota archaeon]